MNIGRLPKYFFNAKTDGLWICERFSTNWSRKSRNYWSGRIKNHV